MFLWKFEKSGYGTVLRTTNSVLSKAVPVGEAAEVSLLLDETAKTPPGMVRVSPEHYPRTLLIPGFEGQPELALKDYWIDQYEVTNRQYKAFVAAGGYQKPDYWKFDFVRDGKKLTRDPGRSYGTKLRPSSAMAPDVPVRKTGSRANIPPDKMIIPSPASVGTKRLRTPISLARVCRPSTTGTAPPALPWPRSVSRPATSAALAFFLWAASRG
jgi:hypothetical protein